MKLCCTTSSFRRMFYAGGWDRAALYQAVADTGAGGLIVEDRCFTERAMWWARNDKEVLAKLGVDLVAIGTSIELFAEPSGRVAGQVANLMEWARIAALSDIGWVEVDIRGPEVADWSLTEAALRQAAEYASGYGTRFILQRVHQGDDRKLLRLAMGLGHRRCRIGIDHRGPLEPVMLPWVQELIVHGGQTVPPVDDRFVCIDPADKARVVEQIRDAVRAIRRAG